MSKKSGIYCHGRLCMLAGPVMAQARKTTVVYFHRQQREAAVLMAGIFLRIELGRRLIHRRVCVCV